MASSTNDLITLDDLEALGVDVSTDELANKAQAWITYVSAYLRVIANNNGLNLDAKMNIDDAAGGSYRTVVKMVVSNAVMRANAKPIEAPDATMYSQSATPYSEMVNYGSNATQDAYFKKKELDLLGLGTISGRKSIGLVRGIRG